MALSQFFSSLKQGLREELRLFEPTTLNKAIKIASMIESKNQSLFKNHFLSATPNTRATMKIAGALDFQPMIENLANVGRRPFRITI